MPRFGASIYSISRLIMSGAMTPERGVEWLAENGAQTIELVPFGIDMLGDPGLAGRLLETAGRCGVPITNYSLNADFLLLSDEEYEAEVRRVKSHIDIAERLGLSRMRIDCAGFRRPLEKNTIEIFLQEMPLIVITYESLCDYAAERGITVLLENHGFHVNGCDRVRQILTSVGRDNFGHQLDIGNYACVDEIPEVATRKMLPFADVIHMKDFYIRPYNRDPGDATQFDCSGSWFKSVSGTFLRGAILGQGDLDIWEIMQSIKSAGFDGDIYVEYEGIEDCLYGTRVSLDNLKRIYAQA